LVGAIADELVLATSDAAGMTDDCARRDPHPDESEAHASAAAEAQNAQPRRPLPIATYRAYCTAGRFHGHARRGKFPRPGGHGRVPGMSRRMSLGLAAFALVVSCGGLLACGGKPPPKPAAPPPPAAAKPAEPQSGALFASVRDTLLPIGCYDATKKAWGSGAACTVMLPVGAQVAMETGAPRAIVGHDAPELGCDLGAVLRTDGPSLGFAVYPAAVRPTVRALPRRRGFSRGAVQAPLLADEKAKIEAQLKAPDAPGNGVISGSAAATLDVDGDGKEDRVLVVRLGPAALRSRFEYVGAVYVVRSAAGRVDLVAADEGADFELRGTLDLDQDGVRELWYASTFVEEEGRNETVTEGLARLAKDRVEPVGEVVVGGAGTCAAEWNDSP
jgi:hypothetical protein